MSGRDIRGGEYVSMEAPNPTPRQIDRGSRRFLTAVGLIAALVITALSVGALDGVPTLKLVAERGYVPNPPHQGKWCAEGGSKVYSKKTLKSVADRTISGLLPYTASTAASKWEASDVIRLGDKFYVVCDSSWSILRISHSLPLLSGDNEVIEPDATFKPPAGEESGFEVIVYDASSGSDADFYVMRESVQTGKSGAYRAQIYKLRLNTTDYGPTSYRVLESCFSEFEFEGDFKGFEGATSLRGADGVLYLLGLCEGNFCSEARYKEVGNGRVVVMKRVDDTQEGCVWKTVRMLELPKSVNFVDYSAFAVHHSSMGVAITSQENSQVWIGKLSGGADGEFDPETAEFSEGDIYDFPRTASGTCEAQYCNIEGIHWVHGKHAEKTPQMLVAVSDKMKGGGKQPAACLAKDQSVHLFTLP